MNIPEGTTLDLVYGDLPLVIFVEGLTQGCWDIADSNDEISDVVEVLEHCKGRRSKKETQKFAIFPAEDGECAEVTIELERGEDTISIPITVGCGGE